MHREIEAKILNVDPKIIQHRLTELGATLERELDLEQVVWWLPDNSPDKTGPSARVRKSSAGSVCLTVKQTVNDGLGYNEWETEVQDYATVVTIIDKLLPNPALRVEYPHHRQDWKLAGALINIDWFPRLSPLVEIEAESEAQVRAIAQKLGFGPDTLVNKGVVTLLFNALGLKLGDKVKLGNAGLV